MVAPIWLIVYDNDPNQSYVFANKDKVVASIEGSIKSIIPDGAELDDSADELIKHLDDGWDKHRFTVLRFLNLLTFIHRIDLDRHTAIGKVLISAHDALKNTDVDLACRIRDLFEDPATT
jgi:hypothetical protein